MKLQYKTLEGKRISPKDGHYFFGYYDLQPFDKTEKYYLAHRVPFMDRLQTAGDAAEIGLITEGKFEPLATTEAWNFQQGAMLQWNPQAADREIIYNDIVDDEIVGVIMDIHTGKKRYLNRGVANVSHEYALGINMSRLYNFRPGYGYARPKDKFYNQNHPKDDGIFLIDLKSGKSKLIISLDDIWEFSGSFFDVEQKMIINHITFNTDGSRFLFLPRNFPAPGERHKTAVITANTDGSDMFILSDYGLQSHYFWKNAEDIIIFNHGKELECHMGEYNTYLIKDKTYEGSIIADGYFEEDNHMSYSPDRKLIVNDSYPDKQRLQHLRVLDVEKNVCTVIGSYYSPPSSVIDIRCDLHPRWNRTGNKVSFDSIHEGFRGIYESDISVLN